MNQPQSTVLQSFIDRMLPGQGWVFHERTHEDIRTKAEARAAEKDPKSAPKVTLWGGHVMLPGRVRLRIEMKGISRDQQYVAVLRQLPQGGDEQNADDWKQVAEVRLPFFNGQSYVEGQLKIGNRTYLVRMIKREGDVLFNLPQVLRTKNFAEAAM